MKTNRNTIPAFALVFLFLLTIACGETPTPRPTPTPAPSVLGTYLVPADGEEIKVFLPHDQDGASSWFYNYCFVISGTVTNGVRNIQQDAYYVEDSPGKWVDTYGLLIDGYPGDSLIFQASPDHKYYEWMTVYEPGRTITLQYYASDWSAVRKEFTGHIQVKIIQIPHFYTNSESECIYDHVYQ